MITATSCGLSLKRIGHPLVYYCRRNISVEYPVAELDEVLLSTHCSQLTLILRLPKAATHQVQQHIAALQHSSPTEHSCISLLRPAPCHLRLFKKQITNGKLIGSRLQGNFLRCTHREFTYTIY